MGEPRVSPGRQNRRKRMSSPDAKKDGRKKAKVDGDPDTSEVNNLGISWFAPLTVLSNSSITSIKKFRETRRINHLLRTDEFHLTRKSRRDLVQESSSKVDENDLPGLVCNDLCNGKENLCIPVTNEVDDPPVAPEEFEYISSTRVPKNLVTPASAEGCNCKGKCTDTRTCSCATLNGSIFPYVGKAGGGRLFEPKAVVFECGPNCGCGPMCLNRTSQQGLKYRLEVYKTPDKGWGVRSWDYIPSGGYVCGYTGVLRKTSDLDNVSGNDYFFEIDCEHTMNGIGVREKRLGEVPPIVNGHIAGVDGDGKLLEESDPDYCIDAASSGNVTRFINHSCEPNLFVQCVLSSHHDVKQARIVLFASENIPPMQELTYDYGYELGSVVDTDGIVKELPCCCGTADCRKRLY
ncbi:PREDICTED: histone-lysine N-methyltransferase, H3 lysine-9 specific SUVH4-like [Fragaria vesca subsp. vesca]|uniref:histone-lysine N-methyltransferase, H3 lysine-9 specific SUVH4-like n=1 Tax=Fragaria vesca subsp. vesca TaxID=101020 RepID=UPI0002C30BC5|nr:PREDICTED: histone-lysine N-methyltransferase, H3 lysine-9 specific SUVH4-like [Fragaria vesca subsp. vesca]